MNFKPRPEQSKCVFRSLLFDNQIGLHCFQQGGYVLCTIEIPSSYRKPSFSLGSFRVIENLAAYISEKPTHDAWGCAVNGQFCTYRSSIMLVSELKVSLPIKQSTQITQFNGFSRDFHGSAMGSMWSDFYSRHRNGSLYSRMSDTEIFRNIGHAHSVLVSANNLRGGVIMKGTPSCWPHNCSDSIEPVIYGGGAHSVFFPEFCGCGTSQIFNLDLFVCKRFRVDHITHYNIDHSSVKHE